MIELTEQQMHAVATAGTSPPVVVDPKTNTALRSLTPGHLQTQLKKDEDFDDSP